MQELTILRVIRKGGKVTQVSIPAKDANLRDKSIETCSQWKTMKAVRELAKALGVGFLPADRGAHVSPRFSVVRMPKVGMKVSYTFNGDYYPCGEITKVSESGRRVVTSTGDVFFRRRESDCWIKAGGTWHLIEGTRDERNPDF